MNMKTYEETTRSILERAETEKAQLRKKNRVIRTAAAFASVAIIAAAGGIGVKALMDQSKLTATDIVYAPVPIDSYTDPGDRSTMPSCYDENAPKTVTVTVEGKEYTGEYKMTILQCDIASMPADERIYVVNDGSEKQASFFSINAETGELVSFSSGREPDKSPIDRPRMLTRARLYAEHWLGENANKYAVDIDWSECTLTYTARRMIDGYRTAEFLRFTLDNKGNLVNLRIPYLGSFDGMASLPYDVGEYESIANEKCRQIARGVANFAYYEYGKKTPVVLADGTVGIVYEVSFHATHGGYRQTFLVSPGK